MLINQYNSNCQNFLKMRNTFSYDKTNFTGAKIGKPGEMYFKNWEELPKAVQDAIKLQHPDLKPGVAEISSTSSTPIEVNATALHVISQIKKSFQEGLNQLRQLEKSLGVKIVKRKKAAAAPIDVMIAETINNTKKDKSPIFKAFQEALASKECTHETATGILDSIDFVKKRESKLDIISSLFDYAGRTNDFGICNHAVEIYSNMLSVNPYKILPSSVKTEEALEAEMVEQAINRYKPANKLMDLLLKTKNLELLNLVSKTSKPRIDDKPTHTLGLHHRNMEYNQFQYYWYDLQKAEYNKLQTSLAEFLINHGDKKLISQMINRFDWENESSDFCDLGMKLATKTDNIRDIQKVMNMDCSHLSDIEDTWHCNHSISIQMSHINKKDMFSYESAQKMLTNYIEIIKNKIMNNDSKNPDKINYADIKVFFSLIPKFSTDYQKRVLANLMGFVKKNEKAPNTNKKLMGILKKAIDDYRKENFTVEVNAYIRETTGDGVTDHTRKWPIKPEQPIDQKDLKELEDPEKLNENNTIVD